MKPTVRSQLPRLQARAPDFGPGALCQSRGVPALRDGSVATAIRSASPTEKRSERLCVDGPE